LVVDTSGVTIESTGIVLGGRPFDAFLTLEAIVSSGAGFTSSFACHTFALGVFVVA